MRVGFSSPGRSSNSNLAQHRPVVSGVSTSAAPKLARSGRARMQRFRIRLIVGDQGDRFAPRRDLRQGLDQAGA